MYTSQTSQNRTRSMHTKQKHPVTLGRDNDQNSEVDLRSATTSKPLKPSNNSKSSNKKPAATPAQMPTHKSQFLIDGSAPMLLQPQHLLVKNNDDLRDHHGPGRHRSTDLKGSIMELIDETYPPLVCPSCHYTSSARSEADQHFKTEHHGNKAFKCAAQGCACAYSSKPGLRYHLEHAHSVTSVVDGRSKKNGNNNGSTSIAGRQGLIKRSAAPLPESNSDKKMKKYKVAESLHKVLDDMYPVTICPACKEEFKKKTHVITHLVEAHHGEEPYKCVIAECKRTKTYATREGLLYHLSSYHDQEE